MTSIACVSTVVNAFNTPDELKALHASFAPLAQSCTSPVVGGGLYPFKFVTPPLMEKNTPVSVRLMLRTPDAVYRKRSKGM